MFTNALRLYVKNNFAADFSDPEKLYAFFSTLQNQQKKNAWQTIGAYARLTGDKAHDYYHNTWSKQFYTSLIQYRPEICELIKTLVQNEAAETVKLVIQQLKDNHQSVKFHNRSLYQMVHFIVTQKQGLIKEQKKQELAEKLSNLVNDLL